LKAKVVIVVVFLVVAGVILWRARSSSTSGESAKGAASVEPAGDKPVGVPAPPLLPRTPTEISLLYSTEKKEWIDTATAQFEKVHPDIKVTLVGKGSLDAAQSILDGKDKPVLFSPADTLVLGMLDADWQTKQRTDLFAKGDDAPQPLVITPLVFAIWEDRAEVLLKSAGGHISWKSIQKAVSSNRGWPAIGGKADWGFVKLGHTDPTKSNSGMQALLLMTLEYYGKTSGLTVADLLKPAYQAFVASVEKGVPKFEASTGTFMTDMIRFGPSKYDIAVVYENLVISQIENAQGRWGNLRVYYPETTLWSDHPIALLQGDWVTAEQRLAARAFVAFLRGRPMQERALSYGFRPADPAVAIRTADGQNPYTRLAPYGVKVDIPPVATPPEAPAIRNMLTMWSRVVTNR
jgi:ABC-type molybdate transport system substrate-binding protein